MGRRRTATAVVVGLLTALLTGCGVGVGGPAPTAAAPSPSSTPGPALYADVAERMAAAGTARYVFSGTGGGQTMSGAGTIRFDGPHAFDADVELTMPQTGQVRAVLVPDASYLALPAVKGLPKSKPWLKVSPEPQSAVGRQLRPVVDQLRSAFDPGQCIGLLRSAPRVEELGPATVEGVSTTHYRGEVSLRRATRDAIGSSREQFQSMLDAGARTLRLDVWIDVTGLPRRFSADLQADQRLYSVTGVYSQWGAPVRIEQPSPKQAFDADKLRG